MHATAFLLPVLLVAAVANAAEPPAAPVLARSQGNASDLPSGASVPGIAELGVAMQHAQALDKAGKYREAERYWRDALARRIALLGKEVPANAAGYSRLAANLEAQGRWHDAEAYRLRAVDMFEGLGAAHVDASGMGRALSELARNLLSQGRTSEAAYAAYWGLSALRDKGDHTVDAAWGYNGVGAVLTAQEELMEAEPFYRRALEIRRAELGDSDVDTATSYNNLGSLLGRLGRMDEAVPLLRRALLLREAENSVGDRTAESASNLGIILDSNGRSDEATPYLEKALAIWRARSGGRVDAAAGYNALGMNYFHLGQLKESEQLSRKALLIRRHALGERHAATGESYANLAVILDAGQTPHLHRRALPLHDKGLAIRTAALGANSLAVADSRANRAECYRSLARPVLAVDDYRAALAVYRTVLGPDHPRTRNAELGLRLASEERAEGGTQSLGHK